MIAPDATLEVPGISSFITSNAEFYRIDTPCGGASEPAGRVAVAGAAWAQYTGIRQVEARIDDGDWKVALLAETVTVDIWRQWVYEWDATPGDHSIAVRVT